MNKTTEMVLQCLNTLVASIEDETIEPVKFKLAPYRMVLEWSEDRDDGETRYVLSEANRIAGQLFQRPVEVTGPSPIADVPY